MKSARFQTLGTNKKVIIVHPRVGLGTTSVSTEVVLGNRYGSVGTTEIENRNFGFFFFSLSRALAAEDPASISV